METVRLPNVSKMTPFTPAPPGALVLTTPEQLDAGNRGELRRQALDLIDRAGAAKAKVVTVDLSATRELDASGLGILVLVQKRAREQGMTTRLRGASEPVRRLLVLTRLDYLFELVD